MILFISLVSILSCGAVDVRDGDKLVGWLGETYERKNEQKVINNLNYEQKYYQLPYVISLGSRRIRHGCFELAATNLISTSPLLLQL